MVDAEYTSDDHKFRENDAYAQAKYDITMRWLGRPAPGTRLLNIGCGGGLFTRLATDAGFAVEACEPDPAAHAIATRNAPPGVHVHLGGLFEAPFAPGAQLIVMHDVLEHIDDDARAVRTLRGLLSPNGRLILSVPALPVLFGLHDELLGHHRRYHRRSLTQVTAPSFRIERLRYFGFTMIPITLLLSRLLRRPYPAEAATGPSALGRAFAAMCALEARIPTPLGTSLICELTPR